MLNIVSYERYKKIIGADRYIFFLYNCKAEITNILFMLTYNRCQQMLLKFRKK